MSTTLETVGSLDKLLALVAREPAVLAYFSTPDCRVCQALRPKVAELLDREFPRVAGVYVDCGSLPQAAGQYRVFSVPTMVVFFEGREWLRRGRSVGLTELREEIGRPYRLLFGSE